MTIKKRLNDSDLSLLKKIYEFSGYTTTLSANLFKKCTDRGINYVLENLTAGGYLKKMRFYSDSRKDPCVYQITSKTCKLFLNPDTYFRKKHEDTYIIRALIKQHFLYQINDIFGDYIVTSNQERIKILSDDIGFSKELLPKKYNKGTSFVHIEEYLLDGRNIKDLSLHVNGRQLIDFSDPKIVIVYVDKYQSNPAAQLLSLLNKYKDLLESESIRIEFLIIVDSDLRLNGYEKSISKRFDLKNDQPIQGIHDNVINLHLKILGEKLKVNPDKLIDLPDKIRNKFLSIEQMTDINTDDIPIKEIRQNGLKAIENLATAIADSHLANDVKLKKVTELFRKVYKLYALGKFKKGADFGIKVYKISQKFSVD